MHCPVHGFSCSGIDWLSEPLERGLTGDSEQVANLLPGVASIPRLLDTELEHLLGQFSGALSASDQVEITRRSRWIAHLLG
jgi:hypothetical protein